MEEGSDRVALLTQVRDLLVPHSQAEESFVYPAIADRAPDEGSEVKDGTAEHHHIEATLGELLSQDPDSPGYDGLLAAMVGELRHHVQEEEEELLPVLAEKASSHEREQMAIRFRQETSWTGDTGDQSSDGDATRAELYEKAKEQDVPGRSAMTKSELSDAVDQG